MPHKHNANRRHRIPRSRYKVTNWKAYEAGLRQRCSLTIWFTEEAVAAPRTTPGGQARYSDLAIETSLILRTVFHQPLRQAEGLVDSLLELMGLDLPVPDHSTLSRRSRTLTMAPQACIASGPVHLLVDSTGVKLSGPGGWLVEKHGTQRRRAWRKLHLAVDTRTGTIVASTLTGKEIDDAAELGPLLDQIEVPLAAVVADGAYDQDRVYDDVAGHSVEAAVVVPPRSTAVLSPSAETDPTQRDCHIEAIAEQGRMGWQKTSGYNARAGAEGCDELMQAHHRRHLALAHPHGPGGRNQDRRHRS
ncbi:IS5 family transposase [Skermanella aerolata]|uniref:IS5 family transposase n=1 Tax=Skermanella aerolata TaxID=393310 RepID=A0A512E3D1_9PROT|nr:transposase ISSpo9 [Skermanella aerolata KACC 11604]GEO43219.1 IS5 family transposase [Skermanella aerolata]